MRFVLAAFLGAHGVAHLVGFVSSWKLATLPELPYKTTVLAGRVDVGDVGIRVAGVLWLLAAVAFIASGIAVAAEAPLALRFTGVVVLASLFICIVGWPGSRIGVAVNLALAALVVVDARLHLIVAGP